MRTRYPTIAALVVATFGAGSAVHGQAGGEWRTDFSRHTVPLEEIVSGGPPKDGIPSIDEPRFVSIGEADGWLDDREPVLVLTLAGTSRAYPLQILMWHEIVNDIVGGTPVAVTYCPLCNTALAFDRTLDGATLEFGTTGRLRHSDLVMYDRQSESWWQQATGEGIVGEYAGRRLNPVSAPLLSWADYKAAFPEGEVLSRETGFPEYRARYGRNPYVGYDRGAPWRRFFFGRKDDRLKPMERVVTVEIGAETVAYPFTRLRERPVVNDDVAGSPIVVFWAPGTASAVDDAAVAGGRDVGASGVFDRRTGGRTLTFEPAGPGRFRDRDTGSMWTLLGRSVAGPLAGTQLRPVVHGNHFWFAWAVFKPDTRIGR